MTSGSALYVGHVTHQRLTPKRHSLRHRVYWLLVDLQDVENLGSKLRFFSHNKTNFMSLYDRDHGDGTDTPLYPQAIAHLRNAGIQDDQIVVQLLCMPRVAGYDFNPLSVYFCSSRDGLPLAVIYEVNNTFGGRHSYVIPVASSATGGNGNADFGDGVIRQQCEKEFYVSPFLDLDLGYRFATRAPAEHVSVAVQARKRDSAIINTALSGQRLKFTDRNILRLTMTHPMLPMKVMGAIHWHAFKMWWRGFAINPAKPSKDMAVSIVRPSE